MLGNEVGQTDRKAQQINLDAVGEVRVLLNTYRAEYGRGGAQIQIVSKGGGAEYRGNAYYYGRREKWNANNFFNNLAGRPVSLMDVSSHLPRPYTPSLLRQFVGAYVQ